jgi:UDP-glucose 4-epimerase
MQTTILVTGAAGYIGSHTVLALLNAGYGVVALDNLSNSRLEALKRVQKITGRSLDFVRADIRNKPCLMSIFRDYPIHAVIHFAGLKAVGESIEQPVHYYDNNVHGTLSLLDAMTGSGVRRLIFSSSATVYGDPKSVPIKEDFPLSTTNPYGTSKLMIENILHDIHRADHRWQITMLRYFNPVGAHESGRIGEDPNGTPSNLMPYISQVACGRLKKLLIYGGDYPTEDGTGVRDYIHVVDLAAGHLKALEKLDAQSGVIVANLGTGRGYSVLNMVHAFEKVRGKKIPYEIVNRRPGDVAVCYADPSKAAAMLGWRAERDQEAMCRDSWRWQSHNPQGYV